MLILLLSPAINKGDVKDTEMTEIMDQIVDSLFSVFVTLGLHFMLTIATNINKMLYMDMLFNH